MTRKRLVSVGVELGKHAVVETVRSILEQKGKAVWSIEPQATVYEAIAEMARRSIGALPVLQDERLVGIISERDYARKVILEGRSSRDTRVEDIMTPSPITVVPEATLDASLWIMTRHRIRHLPVLEAGKMAGIVSIGDLVRAIVSVQAFTIEQLQTYISTSYPG